MENLGSWSFPIACITASLVFLLCAFRHCWRWRFKLHQLPPGPPSLPLIGHLHLLAGGTPHSSLATLAKTYGPLLHIRLGSMPTLVVSSPDLAREFLLTHDRTFASRPYFGCSDRLKGGQDTGLALARYGPGWSELRKITHAQLFTASRVKAELPMVMEEIQRMLAEVRRYAMAGMAYNITKGTSLLLENIICRLVLGRRLEEVCDKRLGCSLKEKLMEGIALFSERPMVGDFIPLLGFLDILHRRRIDAWNASVHAMLHDVVAFRRLPFDHEPKDLLDSLLLAQKDADDIKVILVDFLCGGIDTPSVTLDWAMAELLQHPEIMVKLEEEVDKAMRGKPSEALVEEHHLPNLSYTKAVIKETFRLHPPVPLLVPHMSTRDCEAAGYSIPEGTRLLVNVWAIGRDPTIWEDPLEFLPNRFLNKSEAVQDVRGKHFELLPFGSGRRMCPGVPLTLPMLEMALANLVRSFHWSLPPTSAEVVDMSEKFGSVLCRASSLMALPTIKA